MFRFSRVLSSCLWLSAGAFAAAPASAAGDPSKPVFVVTSRGTQEAVFAGGAARARSLAAPNGEALAISELPAHRLGELIQHVHGKEKRCGGFFAFDSREQAEAFVRDDMSALAATAQVAEYSVDNQATVTPWLAQVRESNIRATIGSLSGNWTTRHAQTAHGRAASDWIRDAWRGLAANRADVAIEQVACSGCGQQPSVVLTWRGNESPGEVVVLGAHMDSIVVGSGGPSAVAPGADDDASGVATLTEVLRVALASGYKPRRTVKFMAYAAEEIGLLGSKAIASDHRNRGENVVGVLQLDMTNYRASGAPDLRLISDNSNAGLQQLVRELYSTYLGGRALAEYRCGYGCSDHASWTAAGYPAAMLFEGGTARGGYSPHIHSRNDTLANMGNSAANSVPFAKLGLAFLGELGKTSAR
ncbi:M20/M25/M40 family metallo-hydrolase [Lysobacter enzymogenes]|uniref:M20/M25/M40 family metallo-hydrolase n=1 Tax=Lysobacter enzymogenes TaxID=69 RepID=UPI000F4B70F1|nr:M20/M25/M40 family metallo-hydrolase [Lysobacter enzymogenes]